ncbi:hypothetical protein [Simkania sp.]|uniref:hypothetical protein n=1 Tax=Simkania sp. TaxID=34094 RepID=UPI003B51B536
MSVKFDTSNAPVIQDQKPLKGILKRDESQKSDPKRVVFSLEAEVQQVWDDSKELRTTAYQSNRARLYKIDPASVGQSRWTGSCLTTIFHWIGSAFSSWWNQDEIKTLQAANKVLSDPTSIRDLRSKRKWGSALVQALNDSKISDQDQKKFHGVIKSISQLQKIHGFESELTPEERLEMRTFSRKAGYKRVIYGQIRAQGRLNHDPKCGTYDFSDVDKRDIIDQSEINLDYYKSKKPRKRKDIDQVNRDWNKEYGA